MDVVEPDPSLLLRTGLAVVAAVSLPAAAVVDPSDLLHVHVDQGSGVVVLVADGGGFGGPDDGASQRVAFAEVRQLVAAEDPRHGPGGDPQLGSEPVLPTALVAAGGHDRCFDRGRGAVRAVVGAGRPVLEPCLALGAVAVDPAVGALPRDTEFFRDVGDRTLLADHPFDEQQATMQVQASVTV